MYRNEKVDPFPSNAPLRPRPLLVLQQAQGRLTNRLDWSLKVGTLVKMSLGAIICIPRPFNFYCRLSLPSLGGPCNNNFIDMPLRSCHFPDCESPAERGSGDCMICSSHRCLQHLAPELHTCPSEVRVISPLKKGKGVLIV